MSRGFGSKASITPASYVSVNSISVGLSSLGGLGTLVRADTQAELGGPGIERNAATGGDTKVKGLILGSAEIDTELFESLRLLGTVLPGGEGEQTDFVSELQLAYSLGRINLAGHGRIGWERGEWTRRYTGLVQVPF